MSDTDSKPLAALWSQAQQLAKVTWGLLERERSSVEDEAMLKELRQRMRCYIGAGTMMGEQSTLGEYTGVGYGSMLWACKVGRFCSIGSQSILGGGEHPLRWPSTSLLFYSQSRSMGSHGFSFAKGEFFGGEEPCELGNDVWIGSNAVVAGKVKVGDGAVVAAGAVVVADVPAYAVVGGNPARLIRFRFEEDVVEELLKLKWWDFDEATLLRLAPMFAQPDVRAFIAAAKKERDATAAAKQPKK